MKIGRNDSCPCGSGKKYKKCHLTQVTQLAQRDASEGPAAQLAAFAEPLIDVTDSSPEAIDKAITMASALWSLAILPNDQRETSLLATAQSLAGSSEEDRAAFLDLARLMIERHEDMFPELHESK